MLEKKNVREKIKRENYTHNRMDVIFKVFVKVIETHMAIGMTFLLHFVNLYATLFY